MQHAFKVYCDLITKRVLEENTMGCDAHCILQYKNKDVWEDLKILDINRDYELFGILAGVRCNTFRALSQPKGLPKDFEIIEKYYHPTELKIDFWEDEPEGLFMGEHSFSWLTVKELYKYNWEKASKKGFDLPEELKTILNICRPLERYRIVFGFDS